MKTRRRDYSEKRGEAYAQISLITLPRDLLEDVAALLPPQDRRNSALTHPALCEAANARQTRLTGGKIESRKDFTDLNTALKKRPNIKSITLRFENVAWIKKIHPPLASVETLSSTFRFKILASFKSFATSFPRLHCLTLHSQLRIGSKTISAGLNKNGELAALTAIPTLRNVELEGLSSEEGLDALIESLSIRYADHYEIGNNYPPGLYCFNCESLHLNDNDDLNYYRDSVPTHKIITVGPKIGKLPNLRRLKLSFNTDPESISYDAMLNRFIFRVDLCNETEGHIHPPPYAPLQPEPLFPALEELDICDAGGGVHFLHYYASHRQLDNEDFCCLDLWHTCVVYEAFKTMPNLQKYRLVGFEDFFVPFGIDDEQPIDWKSSCGKGGVQGRLKYYPGFDGDVEVCCELDRPVEL